MIPSPLRWAVLAGGALALTALGAGAQPLPKAPVFQKPLEKAPAWLKGYRFRWPIQVVGDPAKQKAQTVIVTLPSGGRLKAKAADVAVQAANGDVLPSVVLSHDPAGDTIVQFQRRGDDRWYWAYG